MEDIKTDGKGRRVGINTGIMVDARLVSVPWVLTLADAEGRNLRVVQHHQTYGACADARTRWIEGSQ